MPVRLPDFMQLTDEEYRKTALDILQFVLDNLDDFDPAFYPTLRDKVYAAALNDGWSHSCAQVIAKHAMNL